MRVVLLLAGMILSLAAQPQEIYRWVDKDGVVHYSDQPGSPDAKSVQLAGLNSYEAMPPATGSSAAAAPAPAGQAYNSLSIVQPAPDETFFGADAVVSVVAEVDPTLRPGDSLVFFVDGNRVPATGDLSADIPNLSRGTHFLRAAVLDGNGASLIASQQIMINVRQPSTKAPQSPQNPQNRPPPRPSPAG